MLEPCCNAEVQLLDRAGEVCVGGSLNSILDSIGVSQQGLHRGCIGSVYFQQAAQAFR